MANALAASGCVLTFIVVVVGIGTAMTHWLWNWLAVSLLHAHPISWAVSFGIWVALGFIGSFFRSSSPSKD